MERPSDLIFENYPDMLRAEAVVIDLVMMRGKGRIECLEKIKGWVDGLISLERNKPKTPRLTIRKSKKPKKKVNLMKVIDEREAKWRLAEAACFPHREEIIKAVEAGKSASQISEEIGLDRRKLSLYIKRTLQYQWDCKTRMYVPIPATVGEDVDILKAHEVEIRRWLLDGYQPKNIAKEFDIKNVAAVVMYVESLGFRWNSEERIWENRRTS